MNVYVVLHLREQLAISSSTQFAKIVRKYRNWFKYIQEKRGLNPIPPLYTQSKEAPTGSVHVNWTLHIPDDMLDEFEAKLPGWVEKVTGDLQPYDIEVQRITPGSDKRVANYCAKGVDPTYIEYFKLDQLAEPQGRIYERRASVSTAISKAARDAIGFKAKYHRNDHRRGNLWPLNR